MPEFQITQEEFESGAILIHSDVYQSDDQAHWYWVVKHPASGWSASGVASDPVRATRAIEELVNELSEAQTGIPLGTYTVVRPHLDR